MNQYKILMIAAELTPLAKVGGLADVIGALPKALAELKQDVRIVIPKYGIIKENEYPMQKIAAGIKVPFEGRKEIINLYQTTLPHSTVPIYLIGHQRYLGENGVYVSADASSDGSATEAHRFTFFTRSILEIFETINWTPDILHCHDWHVGMLPPLVKLLNKPMPVLLTIHNLAYQGNYDADLVLQMLNSSAINLTSLATIKNRLDNSDAINYLEQAILNADLINTVSPTYAREILTAEFGCGLEKKLKQRETDLGGILNGIDTERFNPERDRDIAQTFNVDNLNQKFKNKKALQKECGLKIADDIPLIGLIGRLTEQKGFDILLPIMKKVLKQKLQFVLLGAGDKQYEKEFAKLSKKEGNFCARIGFDAKMAQRIYAGSDLFLMPSRFEPCGLGQMIAMRYGALPIVRATGGLKDTVTDLEQPEGTGFVFKSYNSNTLLKTVQRAIDTYQNKEKWQKAQKQGMSQDFSWRKSAKKYLALYEQLINKRGLNGS
ncbi:glycogen synthase [Patescibacteria group bacterium]|nr:glycogen synthase [Patescibacteria group bacterium]